MTFREVRRGALVWETSPGFTARHGFTTRYGGVSRGEWDSLNLRFNCPDDAERVKENYRRLFAAMELPLERTVFTHQVHSDIVRPVTASDAHILGTPVPYDADGVITDETNVPLICFAADCVPILLHDPVSHAIGAVHAGWKGTASDIVGKSVALMTRCYGTRPENVEAAIGPHIGRCCYETGPEVRDAMYRLLGPEADSFCVPRGGKYMTDLGGINRALLLRAGLREEKLSLSDSCTMCLHDRFWSHRYTKGARGVQAGIVCLCED